MTLEGAAGMQAVHHWCWQARERVWPGRRHVPGIVAPNGWGARGADRYPPRRPPAACLLWRCVMDTLFIKVAGLDVHLKTVICAVRCHQESGKLFRQVR